MKYLASLAIVVVTSSTLVAVEPASKPAQAQPLDKAFISFRVGVARWWTPETQYRELLALLEKYKGVTDEITFFTSATHPPLPLEEVKRRCQILSERMKQARALGYRAGVNILSTMGHHEENLAGSLSGDYTRVTDINGVVSQGSFCPNDPRFRQYVRELYQIVVAADPDYIWIDDDVRLAGHMPVGLTCFCDNCLGIFEEESGTKYTRATLRAAMSEGSPEEFMAVRKAWLAHNRATIDRLFGLIERTVHEAKPGLPLGFMTGDRFYEGYDFDNWAKTLAGPNATPVYWRPGGGFYEDTWTGGLAGKSHDIGRQVSWLPASVVSIQSEIENFPYQRLKKAANVTALEAASHMGAGCTGAAFNVLAGYDEPLDEFEPVIARLHRVRPFYDLMARHLGRAQPLGLFAAWNKDTAAAADMFGGAGFLGEASQVLEIGLPAAYSPEAAAVTLLFQPSLATMSKEEILKVLSSGVYMDTGTLSKLNEMGFGELTGLAAGPAMPIDNIEQLSDQWLNGDFAGRLRDCRQSFNHAAALTINKTDPKAETLTRLIDYSGKETASTAMAVFENRLGGRICVAGYFPWVSLHSLCKSAQMKQVMRWLSRDRLPAYVASYHKANLWVRQPTGGPLAIAMVNASFDSADDLVLALLTQSETITVFDMDGRPTVVREAGCDGPYRRFTLPPVESWSARLVVAGE